MKRRPRLAPRELEAIKLLAEESLGMTDHNIAERMGITQGTLKTMWKRIYWKLGMYDAMWLTRYQLAVYWNYELYQIGLRELGYVD